MSGSDYLDYEPMPPHLAFYQVANVHQFSAEQARSKVLELMAYLSAERERVGCCQRTIQTQAMALRDAREEITGLAQSIGLLEGEVRQLKQQNRELIAALADALEGG